MQKKTAYNRLYLLASIWVLYGLYRILKAIGSVYNQSYSFSLEQAVPVSSLAEMLVFGAFSLSIGIGLFFRSKYTNLELLSLPLALLAYSCIWSILQATVLTYVIQLDYLALLLIFPTKSSIKELQISPSIQDWSMNSILFWVMIDIFLFNGIVYLLV